MKMKLLQIVSYTLATILCSSYAQNPECSAPIFLDWSNMTIREGSTALFKCPVDMSASCLADSSIQWYKLNPLEPEQKLLLEDSRLELFSSDPLLMYMTDILREDEGWFICQASNSQGENEARVYLDVLEVPGFKRLDTKVPEALAESESHPNTAEEAPTPTRNVALQMSTAVLTPVTETPDATTTTTTTTERSNKWARFQVYSKYRGSRISLHGAGFGEAYRKALAAEKLIPRTEEEMRTSTTTSTSPRPYFSDHMPLVQRTTPLPLRYPTTTRYYPQPPETTSSPFVLYYGEKTGFHDHRGSRPEQPQPQQPPTGSSSSSSTMLWTRGGKDAIPSEVASHLTHRDHLEAIHDHLRYIYDRLDDLLDRVHQLEIRNQN